MSATFILPWIAQVDGEAQLLMDASFYFEVRINAYLDKLTK